MPSDSARYDWCLSVKRVKRLEDMSPNGSLSLIWDDDGDVIVVVTDESGNSADVEFTNSGSRSPGTLKALYALFRAMEEDARV